MARIVVIGAGVGGLGAALGLADRGHDVLVVERDPPPPTTNGDAAFEEWDRRHVPQFRHAHAFSARSRNLLAQHTPAVLDRLRNDGIEEVNFFKLLAPPELHRPEDEEFTGLLSRRPAFELALRLTAAEHPRVEIRCPALVTGLLHRDEPDRMRIVGVRLGDDLEEPADVVIDAGGRRTPTGRWLRDLGIELAEDVEDCGIIYHTRYYRQTDGSTLPTVFLQGLRAQLDGVFVMGFIGDHRTYSIMALGTGSRARRRRGRAPITHRRRRDARRTTRSRARPRVPAADEPARPAARDPRRPRSRATRTRDAGFLRVAPTAELGTGPGGAPGDHRAGLPGERPSGGGLGYQGGLTRRSEVNIGLGGRWRQPLRPPVTKR